jgi:tetratricopeptide (TPR) repeat protein
MPLVLESLWLIFFAIMYVMVRLELRRLKFNDGQVRAVKHFGTGYQALRDRQYAAAAEYFTRTIREGTPHLDVAYWLRAWAWFELGRIELAEADCQAAMAENLYLTGPYAVRARMLARGGDWPAALEAIDYAIRLNPHDPESYLLRAQLNDRLAHPTRAEADRARAAELIRVNS